jgi:uncharacterized protein (TIGR00730 family)
MNSITVLCGSSSGYDEIFKTQAALLGSTLAKRNIRLIYGGAKVGLMGAVADGALQEGGQVIGVIPGFLQTKEIAHDHLTGLILVESMHERKLKMNELSDGVTNGPSQYQWFL